MAATVSAETPKAAGKDSLPKLLHHVFFWLKNPGSAEDRATLIAGIKKLGAIETVRAIHVGIPASTVKTRMFYARKQLADLLKTAGIDSIAA